MFERPAQIDGVLQVPVRADGLGPAPFSNSMRYQPASRFWEFQGIETGIFLALTALLIYLALRRIRRIS